MFPNKKETLEKTTAHKLDEFFIKQELFPGDTLVVEDRRKIGMDLITKEFVNHF
jgi:hypothetical protein